MTREMGEIKTTRERSVTKVNMKRTIKKKVLALRN